MFLSSSGLSIPACVIRLDWASYISNLGAVDHEKFRADASALADLVIASPISYYGKFSFGTISSGGIHLGVTEPLTLDTKYIVSCFSARAIALNTEVYKAPAYKDHMPITVNQLKGQYYESVASQYVAVCIQIAMCTKLAVGSFKATYQKRIVMLEHRRAQLVPQLSVGYAPVCVYDADGTDIIISTPNGPWPDAEARRVFDVVELRTDVLNSITASITSSEIKAAVSMALIPKLTEMCNGHTFGVSVNAVGTRKLSSNENLVLKEMAGSFFNMPAMILDVIGMGQRVMAVPTYLDAVRLAYEQLIQVSGVEPVIDLDVSPRTLPELVAWITGTADARFLDSVDAFYRRRELPVFPDMPPQLLAAAMSSHPAVLSSATIIGDRTVVYTNGDGTQYTVEFPDATQSGYKFSTSNSKLAAYEGVRKLNDLLQAIFMMFVEKGGVSPKIYEHLGIKGLQRGYAFAQQVQP